MASRQQAGFMLLTRDHVGQTLADYIPNAEQAPGRPDVVGRGHDAHLRFWQMLADEGRVLQLAESGSVADGADIAAAALGNGR